MSKTAPLIPLVAVVGPTASGKSALAMELARFCNGEVVSADSKQIYRYMSIGSCCSDEKGNGRRPTPSPAIFESRPGFQCGGICKIG